MINRREKSLVEKAFIKFVMENCGCPDGGTATSYETALYALNLALQKAKPGYVSTYDVWDILDPASIHRLYQQVLVEQREFIKNKSGLFASLTPEDVGTSYYEKRWCSAALRYLERFREADKACQQFEDSLSKCLRSEPDPGLAAMQASKVALKGQKLFLPRGIGQKSKRGREVIRQVKVRCNQNVFRRAVLDNYQHRCCVSGIELDRVLEAAHIRDWAEDLANALDTRNGLCLSATYHKAFDAHLIEFDDQYRLVLSKVLKDTCTKSAHQRFFAAYEGKRIEMPVYALPDKNALEEHRKLFVV